MAWPCFMFAVVAVVFSGCFQTVHSVGEPHGMSRNIPYTCLSPECIAKGERIKEKMNLSADPCQNFNEFACGRLLKEYVLPPDKTDMHAFGYLNDKNTLIMHDLLVNTTNPNRPSYVKKMQRLFNSCMNTTQIENIGLAPYFKERTFVDDWPTLNPRWSDVGFDLNEVIARYMRVRISPIFVVTVSQNKTDGSRHTIELTQPHTGLGPKYFMRKRNDSIIMAYERYLAEIAVALNANRAVAERDARDLVDLEIALSRIQIPKEKQRDSTKQISEVKLSQFSVLYPRLDIARAIRETFSTVNITLPDDELVVNTFPSYIKDIESVLECFPKRTIQNMLGMEYAYSKVGGLTQQLRNVRDDFYKAFLGVTDAPRWETCLQDVQHSFSMGMSKMFVPKVFSETDKIKVHLMIDNIQEAFKNMISGATWMSDTTKREAFRKLSLIRRKVGYPDTGFSDADLDHLYENYTVSADNYYNNRVLMKELRQIKTFTKLRKLVDKDEWSLAPHNVNAQSEQKANAIALLAGVMQPPFYTGGIHDKYLDYGAIGSIIGHEITHLFDDKGKQYDENGNLRNWWTKEDEAKFVNRSQCIVDQYSNFYVPEINMTLNGNNTKGEAEGDIGGLKASFRAYKHHILNDRDLQAYLGNVEFTPEQLFFISFAQMYCHVATPQMMLYYVLLTHHPPGTYRVNGVMQNSPDFARVYNCPLGSYMNPVKKCGVW